MNLLNGVSLVFDLDGTLVDTAPDLIRVLNAVITDAGLSPTDGVIARRQVGRGAKYLIEQAFARSGQAVSPEQVETMRAAFLVKYEQTIAELSQPFAGVKEELARFKRAGARLSVCTNKPGYLARPLLHALKLTQYFDHIVGSQDGIAPKPNAEHIYAACGHRQTRKIIMIGDSHTDVWAARNAHVPIILMAYGYSETPAAQLRADRTLRSFRQLSHAVTDICALRLTRSFQTY